MNSVSYCRGSEEKVAHTLRYLFFMVAVISSHTYAQARQYAFAELRWGSDIAATQAHLSKQGFAKFVVDKDGDLQFQGTLIGYPSKGWAMFTDRKLAKVNVFLATPDHKAREVYAELKRVLSDKYGAPTKSFEFFEKPYFEGDGFEQQAIRLNKGHFASFWQSDAFAMALKITDKLVISLQYESPEWQAESERRRKTETRVF